jgi:hypothetical protein
MESPGGKKDVHSTGKETGLMTFVVVSVGAEQQETVVGTIWAAEESQAQVIASNLCCGDDTQKVVVRKTENRELPLRLVN